MTHPEFSRLLKLTLWDGYSRKQALARIRLQRMRDRAVESYETKDFIRRREAALRHTRARA